MPFLTTLSGFIRLFRPVSSIFDKLAFGFYPFSILFLLFPFRKTYFRTVIIFFPFGGQKKKARIRTGFRIHSLYALSVIDDVNVFYFRFIDRISVFLREQRHDDQYEGQYPRNQPTESEHDRCGIRRIDIEEAFRVDHSAVFSAGDQQRACGKYYEQQKLDNCRHGNASG